MRSTRVVTGLHAITRPPTRPVVTVGVFDGVHVAHQQLIRSTNALARRLRGTSLVITFDPDPHAVLDPHHAPPALLPLTERVRYLAALGVEWVWVIPFTKRFAHTTAQQFVRQMLIRQLHAVGLIVGEAFLFGRDRQGDMTTLRTLGDRYGMQIVSLPSITRRGAVISSSRIRGLIAHGKLAQVRRLLGRSHALYGNVVKGVGRGATLGFPTANIQLDSRCLPPKGVYAVRVRIDENVRRWRGVMNLGVRPTFGSGPLVCEVHLMGFSGKLCGHRVSIALVARVRRERRFVNAAILVQQIRRDLVRARRLLTTCP